MPLVPTGFVNQAQLDRDVKKAVNRLEVRDVVRVHHNVGVDSTGEPAIYFRIVLTDAASREATLADVTGRVATTIFDALRPYENWGLTPYFSFRSKSEQDQRHDPEWA